MRNDRRGRVRRGYWPLSPSGGRVLTRAPQEQMRLRTAHSIFRRRPHVEQAMYVPAAYGVRDNPGGAARRGVCVTGFILNTHNELTSPLLWGSSRNPCGERDPDHDSGTAAVRKRTVDYRAVRRSS
jgi:hypothetical protein